MPVGGRYFIPRVRFMGRVNGQLWWDVQMRPHGWLVIHAGRWKRGRPGLPRVYWSPNGTPWHHGARNVLREKKRLKWADCVCDDCKARS